MIKDLGIQWKTLGFTASDHYLVCATVKLRLFNQPKEKERIRVKYDTTRLNNENILRTFSIALIPGAWRWRASSRGRRRNRAWLSSDGEGVPWGCRKISRLTTKEEETMDQWRIMEPCKPKGTNHYKINPSTRSERVKRQISTKYTENDREVKRSIKANKRNWMESIADEAEEALKRKDVKTLYMRARKDSVQWKI